MNKKTLKKAVSGDAATLAELRQIVPGNLTVFVVSDGTVDVGASMEAYAYYQINGHAPDEWHDAPTLTLAQAFVQKVKRNPLTLRPITPGVWDDLWSADGHRMVAAIRWGLAMGHIRESTLELKGRVRRHLNTPDQFLLDLAIGMERSETHARVAMDAVLCPLETVAQRDILQRQRIVPRRDTAQQVGVSAALSDLEQEYAAGQVDISRYLKLRANLETEAA